MQVGTSPVLMSALLFIKEVLYTFCRRKNADSIMDCIKENMDSLNQWKAAQKQDHVYYFSMMVAERIRLLSPMSALRFMTKVQNDLLDAEIADRTEN